MLQTLYSILVTKLYNHDVLPGEVGKLSRVSPLKKTPSGDSYAHRLYSVDI